MELKEIMKLQGAFSEIAEIGKNLIIEAPENLSEEQKKEYDKIMNESDAGKQMKEGLAVLNKRREELENLTRGFENFYKK